MCQELGCNSLNKSLSSHVERECLQTWPLLNQGQHGSSFIETKVKLSRVRCSPLEGCAESGLTLDVRPEDPVSSLSRAVSQSAPCPLSHDGGVQEDQQTILLPRLHLLPSSSRDSPRLPGWSPSGRPSLQTRTFLQSSRARWESWGEYREDNDQFQRPDRVWPQTRRRERSAGTWPGRARRLPTPAAPARRPGSFWSPEPATPTVTGSTASPTSPPSGTPSTSYTAGSAASPSPAGTTGWWSLTGQGQDIIWRFIYWNSHFYGSNFYGWSIGDLKSLTESGPFHAQGRGGVANQPWLGSWNDNVTVTLISCREFVEMKTSSGRWGAMDAADWFLQTDLLFSNFYWTELGRSRTLQALGSFFLDAPLHQKSI